MVMPPFFNPTKIVVELVYTVIILFFCFLVYFKTREVYNLTKHKGIGFFRYAFLFFGLAYASRLFLHILMFSNAILSESIMPRMAIFPLSNLVVAYLSTMAILYLTYSTVWKKIKSEHFLAFSNLIALLVAVIAFISRSPMIVSLIQLLLLLFTILVNLKIHKKDKKASYARALYLLVSAFWLLNLFVLGPRRFLPFELKVAFQILSVFVFVAIYYKVAKWIK